MTIDKKRLLAIILAILMLFQTLEAFGEQTTDWNETVSNVVKGRWYTIRFVTSGDTVLERSILSGSAVGTLPEAPEIEGACFQGWYIGDAGIDESYIPEDNETIVARYASTAAGVNMLSSETALGMLTYSAYSEAALPEGAKATLTVTDDQEAAEKAMKAAKPDEFQTARTLGVYEFGVSDLYWTLEGTLQITLAFDNSLELYEGEQLYLFDARTLDEENISALTASYVTGETGLDDPFRNVGRVHPRWRL